MRPLIITYVRHGVRRCCKGNATGLEPLACDNEWLIGDVCLSWEWRSCEECDLCLIQDIELVIDWFSAVMWGAMNMSNSPVGGASEISCPPDSVDQQTCRAGTFCYK